MRGEEILEAANRRKGSIQVKDEYEYLLQVSLDGECYGLSIEDVVEVIGCPKVFNIPHTPDYILGVINLRGEILAIIDIRKLLGRSVTPSNDQKHIVVVERGNVRIGILVNTANDVVRISHSAIKPSLSTADKAGGLITGEVSMQGEVLAILDSGVLMEL